MQKPRAQADVLSESQEEAKSHRNQEVPKSTKQMLNQTELSGFIEKDMATGKIEIKGFALSIKGLTTEHEQVISFFLGEWKLILNVMKLYNEPLRIMIGNYKSSQEEMISKRKLIAVLKKYVKLAESKNRGKPIESNDVLSK